MVHYFWAFFSRLLPNCTNFGKTDLKATFQRRRGSTGAHRGERGARIAAWEICSGKKKTDESVTTSATGREPEGGDEKAAPVVTGTPGANQRGRRG